MIDEIENALSRIGWVSLILWFVGCLTQVLTTAWMWATPAKAVDTVMGIFVVILMPFTFFAYIMLEMYAESYNGGK